MSGLRRFSLKYASGELKSMSPLDCIDRIQGAHPSMPVPVCLVMDQRPGWSVSVTPFGRSRGALLHSLFGKPLY